MTQTSSGTTCMNCEFAPATLRCVDCKDDYLFCIPCGEVHLKVKAFRRHTMNEYKPEIPVILCSNCDVEVSKFLCKDCPEGDCHFCVGCSIVHTKVKQFRLHVLVPVEQRKHGRRPTAIGMMQYLHIMYTKSKTWAERVLVAFKQFTYDESKYSTVLIGAAMCFVLVIVRMLLGRNMAVVATMICFALIRLFGKGSNTKKVEELFEGIKSMQPKMNELSESRADTRSIRRRDPRSNGNEGGYSQLNAHSSDNNSKNTASDNVFDNEFPHTRQVDISKRRLRSNGDEGGNSQLNAHSSDSNGKNTAPDNIFDNEFPHTRQVDITKRPKFRQRTRAFKGRPAGLQEIDAALS